MKRLYLFGAILMSIGLYQIALAYQPMPQVSPLLSVGNTLDVLVATDTELAAFVEQLAGADANEDGDSIGASELIRRLYARSIKQMVYGFYLFFAGLGFVCAPRVYWWLDSKSGDSDLGVSKSTEAQAEPIVPPVFSLACSFVVCLYCVLFPLLLGLLAPLYSSKQLVLPTVTDSLARLTPWISVGFGFLVCGVLGFGRLLFGYHVCRYMSWAALLVSGILGILAGTVLLLAVIQL